MTREINLDFNKLNEVGQIGIRRAAVFVAMGQKAWSDEKITSATVQAPIGFKMLPDPLPKELADDVRSSFRLWVIGHAITEIVQALSKFSDELFQIAILVPLHKKEMEQKALDKIRKCEVDTNLHAKLIMLEEDSGVKSPLLDHTFGWSFARNCLAHNQGIVRERDFIPGTKTLTVNWREFKFSIDGKKIDNIIGHTVENGGNLEMSLGHGSKDFKLGEQISFSEQEILNICLTAHLQTAATVKELEKHVKKFVDSPEKDQLADIEKKSE